MQHKSIKELLPVLTKSLRKGDCGKIGVIGGSAEYTGAPYFSAITPMKIGADLCFVYTTPAAAPVIKGYSPELIVYPNNNLDTNRHSIERLDALVFGPGLGREEHKAQMLRDVIQFAKETPTTCVVIDADGLFYIKDCLKELAEGCSGNVMITPNHREFSRLFSCVFPEERVDEMQSSEAEEQTKKLAHRLGITLVRKGERDLISNGEKLVICDEETSSRRCGGQGDILGGAIALFAYWAKLKEANKQEKTTQLGYTTEHLMNGALAASQLVRQASLETFQCIGRAMNAADVIAKLPAVISRIEEHYK